MQCPMSSFRIRNLLIFWSVKCVTTSIRTDAILETRNTTTTRFLLHMWHIQRIKEAAICFAIKATIVGQTPTEPSCMESLFLHQSSEVEYHTPMDVVLFFIVAAAATAHRFPIILSDSN